MLMTASPLPVRTFSTRRLLLSNSIGLESRFLMRSATGLPAGISTWAGSKAWSLTVIVTSTASCAWAGAIAQQQANAAAATPAKDAGGHDAPGQINAILRLPKAPYHG